MATAAALAGVDLRDHRAAYAALDYARWDARRETWHRIRRTARRTVTTVLAVGLIALGIQYGAALVGAGQDATAGPVMGWIERTVDKLVEPFTAGLDERVAIYDELAAEA